MSALSTLRLVAPSRRKLSMSTHTVIAAKMGFRWPMDATEAEPMEVRSRRVWWG